MYKIGVIDLGFGDSGKGVTTSLLCSNNFSVDYKNKLVIRSNGGHQAGHTVTIGDKKHIFSQFGSGSLQGVPSYLSRNFTIEPEALLKEYYTLLSIGIVPKLFVDNMAMLTMPWDIERGIWDDQRKGHGTVGVGFGQTVKRNEEHYKLHFQDIYFPKILRAKINNIAQHYYGEVIDERMDDFFKSCEIIAKLEYVKNINERQIKLFCIRESALIIFESAQGVLLDQEFGFFPNVTRSHTTCRNMNNILGDLDEVFYVTRTYQTRHGNGYMSNEDKPIKFLYNDHTETNKAHPFQGEFRKTEMDTELLKYSILSNENYVNPNIKRNLVITCYDQLEIDIQQLINDLEIDFDCVWISKDPDGTKMERFSNLK